MIQLHKARLRSSCQVRESSPKPTRSGDKWRRSINIESGYTLVELMIALALFSLLTAITMPIITTFFNTNAYITNSYENLDQLLPISTNLQNLIRSAVSPAPNIAGSSQDPIPAFGIYSNGTATSPGPNTQYPISTTNLTPTQLTFFTNAGNSAGPSMVVATLVGTTFTVTTSKAVPNTCPTSYTSTAKCDWETPLTMITVDYVANTNIFSYTVVPEGGGATSTYSTLSEDQSEFGPNTAGTQTCTQGTATEPYSNCPAGEIQTVQVNLVVNVAPSNGLGAQQSISTYALSTSSQAYQPSVG